jgi:two-component system response regulator PilR (NtrC family)
LEKLSKSSGKEIKGITPEALDLLKGHQWKGNVRELENVLERSVALVNGDLLRPEDLQPCLQRSVISKDMFLTDLPEEGLDLEDLMNHIEKSLLLKALDRSHWVKKEAARLLRLNFRSFRYRLAKYGIRKGGQNETNETEEIDESDEQEAEGTS